MFGRASSLPSLCIGLAIVIIATSTRAEVAAEVAYARAVLAHHDGDDERAIELFDQVLDAEPDHLGAARFLGRILMSREAWDDALDVLEPAAAAHPDDVDLMLDLGVIYLMVGNLAFAARTLAAVVEASPEDAQARFHLGAALARQGDCDLAARHLAEARRLDQAFEARSRYLAGLCRAREGDIEQARDELEPLAASPLDDPIADNARRFVRMALRADGIETARFSARAAISVQYDSNPTVAPRSLESYDSVAPVLQADATLRALATEHHTIAGRLSFYRSFYFPDEHAADYDFTHVAASAFYQLRGRLGGARHQLQIGYDFALGLFDGEPPLADQHHLYSELHGGRVLWSIRETDDLQTRLSILVQSHTYAVGRRNSLGATVGIGQTVAVPRAGLQIYLEGTMRAEDAESLDYDVIAPGALLSISARLPWELMVSGFVLYEHEAHPGSREDRADDQINATISMQREIIDHLGLSLSWMYTANISNVSRFDYRRNVLSLTLWGVL